MFSLGNHDMEHQRLIRLTRIVPVVVASLPAITAASPYTGQRVNYQNLDWYSDGTQWLSTQVFNTSIATKTPAALPQATTVFAGTFDKLHSAGGVYLIGLDCSFVPSTVIQSGALFYTLTGLLQAHNNTPAGIAITLSGTVDTKTFVTVGLPYEMSYTLTQAVIAAYHRAALIMTVTGAAGTFFFEANLSYRLIGV